LARASAPAGVVLSGLTAGDDPAEVLRAYWTFDLAENERRARTGPDRQDQRAVALIALGRYDEAIGCLERAVARRAGWLPPFLRVDPWFDPLREDPRFRALLERIDATRSPTR